MYRIIPEHRWSSTPSSIQDPGGSRPVMYWLFNAAANRPPHPFRAVDLPQALQDVESFEILIEATPWVDVHRAGSLGSGSLRYADAIYVAAAERHATALLTADIRIERSGAPISCKIIGVVPAKEGYPHHRVRPTAECSSDSGRGAFYDLSSGREGVGHLAPLRRYALRDLMSCPAPHDVDDPGNGEGSAHG